MEKSQSASDIIQYVRSGERVFVHGGAATPNVLLAALVEQTDRLKNVELIHLHTMGPANYAKPKYKDNFKVTNLFVGPNPSVAHLDIGYVNNPNIIARNNKVAAINSAVEIDLTGQVCADSVGTRIISGVGGQMDFMRGASLSKGGMPIIALTSRTHKNIPRIVPILKPGAGVVTTRAHVHFVVTEYGVCELYGKTLRERAEALIKISHPDDHEDLTRAWHDNYFR